MSPTPYTDPHPAATPPEAHAVRARARPRIMRAYARTPAPARGGAR